MIELLGATATILAVTGVLLNNRKLIACFYVWLVSNAITAYIHCDAQLYSLLIRDVIFLGLAVEGLYRWGKTTNRKEVNNGP